MFDALERLRGCMNLQQLLSHYAEGASTEPPTWRDRLMQMEGVEEKELVQLHGELIAHSWVAQHTGAAGCCYQITPAGLRALKESREPHTDDNIGEVDAPSPNRGCAQGFGERRERRKKCKSSKAVGVHAYLASPGGGADLEGSQPVPPMEVMPAAA